MGALPPNPRWEEYPLDPPLRHFIQAWPTAVTDLWTHSRMSGWFSILLSQVYFKYLTNYYIIELNEIYADQFMNT